MNVFSVLYFPWSGQVYTDNVGYHQEINQPLFIFNLIFLPIFEAPLAAPTLRTTQFENRVSSFDWSSRSGSVVEFHVWFHLPPIPRSGCLRKAIKPKMFWITKTSSQDTVTQDRRGQIAHWCKRCKRWGVWPWPCASCLTLRTLWHPVDKYCLLTHWKIHTGRSHPRLTNEWTHTHTHTRGACLCQSCGTVVHNTCQTVSTKNRSSVYRCVCGELNVRIKYFVRITISNSNFNPPGPSVFHPWRWNSNMVAWNF